MQLKKKSIRRSLSLATGTLLSWPMLATSAQAEDRVGLDTQISQLYYAEENRVTVNKFEVRAKKELGDDDAVTADFIFDTMTGASPNGRFYQGDSSDTSTVPITTASGFSFTTANTTSVAQSAAWLSEFEDTRKALALEWERTWVRVVKTQLGANTSVENDYQSNGLSGNLSFDLFEKNTTFTAGASVNNDNVNPVGGIPSGLGKLWCTETVANQPSRDLVNCDLSSAKFKATNKVNYQYLVGITQVWNRSTLMQLNFSQQLSEGYLTDPYKQLSVLGAVGGETEEVGILYEKRPDSRLTNSIFGKLVMLPFDWITVNTSFRYFWDNWKIKTYTGDFRLRADLGAKFYAQWHFRGSRQNQAFFYRTSFASTDLLPQYASADHRLSTQDTVTGGVKLGYDIGESQSIATRVDYMYQRYRNNAIPHMKALIVQFLMQARF